MSGQRDRPFALFQRKPEGETRPFPVKFKVNYGERERLRKAHADSKAGIPFSVWLRKNVMSALDTFR